MLSSLFIRYLLNIKKHKQQNIWWSSSHFIKHSFCFVLFAVLKKSYLFGNDWTFIICNFRWSIMMRDSISEFCFLFGSAFSCTHCCVILNGYWEQSKWKTEMNLLISWGIKKIKGIYINGCLVVRFTFPFGSSQVEHFKDD